MKIKEVLKKIGFAISLFLSGFLAAIFFSKREIENVEETTEKKRNELKEKSADSIIAESIYQSDIQSGIATEKDEFRKRVRDRLKQNL